MNRILFAAVLLTTTSLHGAQRTYQVAAGNTIVHVVEDGDPSKPVLVLLHGITSSVATWNGWVECLRAGYRILRLDLPGSGDTPRPNPDDPRIDADTRVVEQVLDTLGVREYAVAGNSRGGWIAWMLASRSPHVAKLILISPIGVSAKATRIDRLGPAGRFVLRHFIPRWAVRKVLQDIYGSRPVPDDVVDAYWRASRKDDNRGAVSVRIDPNSFVDHGAALRDLAVPTLILWGGRDANNADDACRFVNRIRGSRIVVLKDRGHVSMEEDPVTTARLADQFLRGGEELSLPDGARTDCHHLKPTPILSLHKHAPPDDDLSGGGPNPQSFQGKTYYVFGNSGPPVILLHELPGLTGNTVKLANELAGRGFMIYVPLLFGDYGKRGNVVLAVLLRSVDPRFLAFRSAAPPITRWVEAFAADIHGKTKADVGVIGMCLTGNIPPALLKLPYVRAAVMSQPAIPFLRPAAIGLSASELQAARDGEVEILAFRFTDDAISPWERMDALREAFGSQLHVEEVDSSPDNGFGFPGHSHPVLTDGWALAAQGAQRKKMDELLGQLTTYLHRQLDGGADGVKSALSKELPGAYQ